MRIINYTIYNTKELRSSKIRKEIDITMKECSKKQKYETNSLYNLKLII